MSLRIGIDAINAVAGGGLGYARNLVRLLPEIAPDADVLVYGAGARFEVSASATNVTHVPVPRATGRWPRRWLAQQTGLAARARRDRLDVLLSAVPPPVFGAGCARVVVMHSILPFSQEAWRAASPSWRAYGWLLRQLYLAAWERVEGTLFVSHSLRDAFAAARPDAAPRGRSAVIENGYDEAFRPEPAPDDTQIREALDLTGPYCLYVSHLTFYKRHIELLRAFARVRRTDLSLVLVGVGVDPAYTGRVLQTIQELGLGERARWIGEIDRDRLPAVSRGAEFVAFPSDCEACPISLIEALGCGLPVAASDYASSREICGDAAVYFDAASPESIAAGLEQLAGDPSLRARLAAQGRERVARYSWDRTAAQTLFFLREVVGSA